MAVTRYASGAKNTSRALTQSLAAIKRQCPIEQIAALDKFEAESCAHFDNKSVDNHDERKALYQWAGYEIPFLDGKVGFGKLAKSAYSMNLIVSGFNIALRSSCGQIPYRA